MAQSSEAHANTSSMEMPTEAAYAAILPELMGLAVGEVMIPNLDILNAVSTAFGVLPKLRPFRAQIARELPDFDLERFDKLETYALALSHANVLNRIALAPKSNVTALARELTLVRDRLFAAAMALSSHGLIEADLLARCKRAAGYRALTADVSALVAMFEGRWTAVQNKTPVTRAALKEAGRRALELTVALGRKERAPVRAGEALEQRQRAFTLFVHAYADARRALVYLRGARGDADDIVPSLYARRRRRRGKSAPEAESVVEIANAGVGTSSSASTGGTAEETQYARLAQDLVHEPRPELEPRPPAPSTSQRKNAGIWPVRRGRWRGLRASAMPGSSTGGGETPGPGQSLGRPVPLGGDDRWLRVSPRALRTP